MKIPDTLGAGVATNQHIQFATPLGGFAPNDGLHRKQEGRMTVKIVVFATYWQSVVVSVAPGMSKVEAEMWNNFILCFLRLNELLACLRLTEIVLIAASILSATLVNLRQMDMSLLITLLFSTILAVYSSLNAFLL